MMPDYVRDELIEMLNDFEVILDNSDRIPQHLKDKFDRWDIINYIEENYMNDYYGGNEND